jgi:allantoin racemase
MRIRVINPNTTASMTRLIGESARLVAGPGVQVEAVSPSMGPSSIESHYDEALAVPGILAEVTAGEAEGVDGYVIACFGDPGLEAARELATGPVVAIAEAAMRTATYLGRSFSVVTTLGRTRGRAWDLAHTYGVASACRGVHACEIPVLELESSPDARDRITEACRQALAIDESDVVVLGCAGMADLCAHVSEAVGAPVVDGVAAATVTVQGLVTLGLRTSAVGELAAPLPKAYAGLLSGFTIDATTRKETDVLARNRSDDHGARQRRRPHVGAPDPH